MKSKIEKWKLKNISNKKKNDYEFIINFIESENETECEKSKLVDLIKNMNFFES